MLTIYGVPVSVHTRKVIVTALEKGLDYRNEPVVPFRPPAGWRELSPTGKIPVVTDGALVLRDSSVICAWLERVHPGRPLYPAKPEDYAHALWIEEYADGVLFPQVVHGLFFQRIIRPAMLGEKTDPGAVAEIQERAVPQVFGYLERSVKGEHLAGDEFSIADVAVMSNLVNFHYLGYSVDARFPALRAYFSRHLSRPSLARALDAETAAAASMGLEARFRAS